MKLSVFLGVIALCLMWIYQPIQAVAHKGATGVVKQRMDYFKESQKRLKSISRAIKAKDYRDIQENSAWLAQWGGEMISLFPEDSLSPPTEASPLIWENFDDFSAHAQVFMQASRRLALHAEAEDYAATTAAFREVAQSCKACHSQYRVKN